MWKCGTARVSDMGRVFRKINERMDPPVGIVLAGADCELKGKIYMRCVEQIPDLVVRRFGRDCSGIPNETDNPFSNHRNVLVMMDGDSSGKPEHRLQLVEALKALGAETVVGFYAHYDPAAPSPGNLASSNECNDQAQELLKHPPVAEEFDYLFTPGEEADD